MKGGRLQRRPEQVLCPIAEASPGQPWRQVSVGDRVGAMCVRMTYVSASVERSGLRGQNVVGSDLFTSAFVFSSLVVA